MNESEFHTRIPPKYTLVEGNRSGVLFRPDTVNPDVMDTVRRLEKMLSGKPALLTPVSIIGRVIPGSPDAFPLSLGKPGRRTVFLLDGDSLRKLPRSKPEIQTHVGLLPGEITDGPLAIYVAPDTGLPVLATWEAVLARASETGLVTELGPKVHRGVRIGSYDFLMAHGLSERHVRHILHTRMGVNDLYQGDGTIFNHDTRKTVSAELIGPNVPTLNPMGAILFVGE